jgi:hypothetical protein
MFEGVSVAYLGVEVIVANEKCHTAVWLEGLTKTAKKKYLSVEWSVSKPVF